MSVKEILVVSTDVLIYGLYVSLGLLFIALAVKRYVDKLDEAKFYEIRHRIDSKELVLLVYKRHPRGIIKSVSVDNHEDNVSLSKIAFIIQSDYRSAFYYCFNVTNPLSFQGEGIEETFIYNHPIVISHERGKAIDKILKDI